MSNQGLEYKMTNLRKKVALSTILSKIKIIIIIYLEKQKHKIVLRERKNSLLLYAQKIKI